MANVSTTAMERGKFKEKEFWQRWEGGEYLSSLHLILADKFGASQEVISDSWLQEPNGASIKTDGYFIDSDGVLIIIELKTGHTTRMQGALNQALGYAKQALNLGFTKFEVFTFNIDTEVCIYAKRSANQIKRGIKVKQRELRW